MILRRTAVVPSPDARGKVRLIGDVTYEKLGGRGDRYWIEVDESYSRDLSESGNPWVPLLLPLAVTLDEPLVVTRPVDPRLLAGADEVMAIWHGWYPGLRPIAIRAEERPAQVPPTDRRRAAFYSGGIDSLHTVLQDLDESRAAGRSPVEDHIHVLGFDSPARRAAHRPVREAAQRAAARFGRELVFVETNVRQTRFRHADFMDLAYGATLAAMGLALERRYSEVLISAGFSPDTGFAPHGSHPETDPRFSTRSTRIVHYGGDFGRVEKTRRVAASDLTKDLIRVCWTPTATGNCGRCPKCVRTQIALDIAGLLDGCPSFDTSGADLVERVSGFRARHEAEDAFLRENLQRAREAGRADLARAIETAIGNCGRFRRMLRTTTRAGRWLRSHPVFWDRAGERLGTAFGKAVRALTGARG